MVHAIRIHENGGPEVLKWEEVDVADPAAGEIRVRHTAVGLNYIDTYLREGARPLPLPAVLGLEGAGVVEALGDGVSHLAVGDRIGYADMPVGAYAEERVMPAHIAVKLPDGVDDRSAAAAMLKGMTAQFLIRQCFRVEPGMTVLLHAAAGGVGLIASQWLNHLGATVIGTVGSPEKGELAKAHGVHHIVNYNTENFVERVQEITDGAGVPVVYDGVGKDTLMDSMKCLSPLGMLVSFGNASGAPDPVNLGDLSTHGSIFITRPMLFHYTATRAALETCANDLFDVISSGAVKIEVNQTYPLSEAAQAHRDLEARKTNGSTVLLPPETRLSNHQPIDTKAARKALEALREQVMAATEQGAEAAQPVELDQQRMGRLSRMDALQGQEMARAAERRRETEIRKIDAALARLDSDEFGWCVRCGEEIAPERLRLDPAVPVCIDCAKGGTKT